MMDIQLIEKDGNEIDVYNEAMWFQICISSKETGMVRMEHSWDVVE